MLVTVTSLQMPKHNAIPADNIEFDAQLICDVKCNLKNHKLFSFPWRPGNLLYWFYIFTIIDILVLLLTSVVCALFANTVKAMASKNCSAGYPCYSVFHTLALKAEEYEKELLRSKPVVRNLKHSMAHLFPVQPTRPVEYETVMYDAMVYVELPDKSLVETVAYKAGVYDEISVFLAGIVILYPSYADVAKNELPTVENLLPDVAQYELPPVENLLPDVALDKLPAVEDLLSASVDIRQRYQL